MVRPIDIPKEEMLESMSRSKTQADLARLFGVSGTVIRRNLKVHGLTFGRLRVETPSKEKLVRMYRYLTMDQIAEKVGVHRYTVRRYFRDYGIDVDRSSVKHVKLTQVHRDVIVGSLLGDGSIENRNLAISHSIKQKEYLEYKLYLLSELCNGKIYDRKVKGRVVSNRIRTLDVPELRDFKKEWYPNGRRIVPKNIEGKLSPLALAIWFMDDGTRKGKTYGNIATHSFTKTEVKRLVRALNNRYNLGCRLEEDKYRGKTYYIIKLPSRTRSLEKLTAIIKPFVVPSMRYKLCKV